MVNDIFRNVLLTVFPPLFGALIAGLLGRWIGRRGAHRITIGAMMLALVGASLLVRQVFCQPFPVHHLILPLYPWAVLSGLTLHIGFFIDKLSVVMMWVVCSVSLLVHLYSIGYMAEDKGYQRFFSYISLFTFCMLMLVSADNFLQLFFGWEGVGLASYLLIGFWHTRESALQGSLKAFLVNRVGDFGFLLGIAAILKYFGTLDYEAVFQTLIQAATLAKSAPEAASILTTTVTIVPMHSMSVITLIALLLFVGAMGKSAQVPLHVWLPESMEGPTPISALIHAATMVTAGIFMISRLAPLYHLSPTALSVVLCVGATGSLMMGAIGIVQNDIKRIVAYSTLSQLGYMIAALGAGAFSLGMFHLVTHAFFKALLFLGAGSVILAMHHEQDIRRMGGLARHLPITYITTLIGSLALAGIPPFSGFYSKDLIIEAIQHSAVPGARYAYLCVLSGVFVTALYTFRSLLLTFHGQARFDVAHADHLHEPSWVVWVPLIILAIPSAILGAPLVHGVFEFNKHLLVDADVLEVIPSVVSELHHHFHGSIPMAMGAFKTAPFMLAMLGVGAAIVGYVLFPRLPDILSRRLSWVYRMLVNRFGFDAFNDLVFVRGSQQLGQFLFRRGDIQCIDDGVVLRSARIVNIGAHILRYLQTGFVYHYALVVLLGLLGGLAWLGHLQLVGQ